MVAIRRVLVGHHRDVAFDGEIGFRCKRRIGQLARLGLVAEPGVARRHFSQRAVARRGDLAERLDGLGVTARAIKRSAQKMRAAGRAVRVEPQRFLDPFDAFIGLAEPNITTVPD